MEERDYTFRYLLRYPLMRDLVIFIAFVLLMSIAYYLWRIFLPIALGLILGYLTHPVIERMYLKWRVNRKLSSAFIIGMSVSLIIIFMAWASPIIVEQSNSLVEQLPNYLKTIEQKTGFDLNELTDDKTVKEWVTQSMKNIQNLLTDSGKVFGLLKNLVTKALYIFFVFMAVPVFWFYFAAQFEQVKEWINGFIPASKRYKTHKILRKMDIAVFGFFKGRLLVVTIMGLMFSFGWWLADVPYWFLLGMFTGFLNFVPYLSAVGWPLAILAKYIEFEQGNLDSTIFDIVFWPSLVYGVVQFIEGWFITPYVQSEQTYLTVPVILVSIFVGGYIGGILGMILAIPFAACVKIFQDEYLFPTLRNWAEHH